MMVFRGTLTDKAMQSMEIEAADWAVCSEAGSDNGLADV
jgi:hypothetical protein